MSYLVLVEFQHNVNGVKLFIQNFNENSHGSDNGYQWSTTDLKNELSRKQNGMSEKLKMTEYIRKQ